MMIAKISPPLTSPCPMVNMLGNDIGYWMVAIYDWRAKSIILIVNTTLEPHFLALYLFILAIAAMRVRFLLLSQIVFLRGGCSPRDHAWTCVYDTWHTYMINHIYIESRIIYIYTYIYNVYYIHAYFICVCIMYLYRGTHTCSCVYIYIYTYRITHHGSWYLSPTPHQEFIAEISGIASGEFALEQQLQKAHESKRQFAVAINCSTL